MVETVGIHQVMWFVMLNYAKDRVIGLDTPGQQVPPCVRYQTICLQIRDAMGSVPCSDQWEIGVVTCHSTYHFTTVLSLLLPHMITLFLHLLSTNHKCTQPCYFPLLLKLDAQKEKMDWNSSMRSSRLRVAPVAIPLELWSPPLFYFVESRHSFQRLYLCNNYTLVVTFGYM
jgi:hypothetical protein